jgi:heat shock protein HslJ
MSRFVPILCGIRKKTKRIEMIQRLFFLLILFFLGCGLAQAGELYEINFDKIVSLSGWTKSGKVQLVKANEEILGKADPLLIDTLWRWQQTLYNNDTKSIPLAPENYTLKLLPDGKVSIRADCNLGGGVYTLRGNEISIKITHTTRAACPPESLEHSYIRDLNIAARYCIEGDFLYIDLKNDIGTMKFIR